MSICYVHNGVEVRDARVQLDAAGLSAAAIATRVETRSAVIHFDEVLEESDAIIVSR